MKKIPKLAVLAVLAAVLLVAGSCRSRTDRTPGPVLLTFGAVNGIPTVVSVTTAIAGTASTPPGVAIQTFTLLSVVKDPNASITPAIEDVEVSSYQVVYRRRDTGTRLPPPLVAALAIQVPVNGTSVITNLPIVRLDQLLSPPLGDLASLGHDPETGTTVIVLDAQITFFGHTLSGDAVSSGTASYTLEFTP